jgi:transcriptional regulator with XRE-family HTH domain
MKQELKEPVPMNNDIQIFAANLNKRLKELNYSKAKLAKDASLSYATVVKILQADYNPSLKAMSQLATAMHIPLAHLLVDEEQNMLPAPHGFKRIQAILPDFQAFKVQQWNDEALLKLKKIK